MIRNTKQKTAISLILLVAMLLAAASQSINFAAAQSDTAIIIVMPTTGGTTTPVPGQYEYANGTNIVLTAIPNAGYVFKYWLASGDLTPGHSQGTPTQIVDPDTGEVIGYLPKPGVITAIDSLTFTKNPTNITCGYGYTYTYTAIFAPASGTAPSGTNNATVIIMPTTGGTTSPAPGQYEYANGTNIVFSAVPNAGYKFDYWVASGDFSQGHGTAGYSYITDPDTGAIIAQFPKISTTGIDTLTFTKNPANVTCGYGYTFVYTAIFSKVSAASPTPAPTAVVTATPTLAPTASPTPQPTATPVPTSGGLSTEVIIAIVVVVIIIIVAVAVLMMRRKK